MTRREASAEQGGVELPKVFINYRHEDAEEAAVRLYERLAAEFGDDNVFLDAKTLGVGVKWLEQIKAHGDRGSAFLALIGPQWLAHLEQRKQLTARDPQDYVMLELELALHRWRGKVIPVLLGRTSMPAAVKLPKPIRALAGLQATRLRALSFDEDVDQLIEEIRSARVERAPRDGGSPPDPAGASAVVDGRHDPDTFDDKGSLNQASRERTVIAAPDASHYEHVLSKMIDQGSVVPVLGSGVRGALPDSDQLAAHLSERFRLGLQTPDLAEVAQRVAVSEGLSFLDKAMFEALTPAPEPQDVHRFLARFPARLREAGAAERYQMIVTTNYDGALEQAFDEQGEEYNLAVFLATGTDAAGTNKGKFLHVPWHDEPRVVSQPATYRDLGIDRFDDLERTLIVKVHGAAEGRRGRLPMGRELRSHRGSVHRLPRDRPDREARSQPDPQQAHRQPLSVPRVRPTRVEPARVSEAGLAGTAAREQVMGDRARAGRVGVRLLESAQRRDACGERRRLRQRTGCADDALARRQLLADGR
jgi:hypothetical protein